MKLLLSCISTQHSTLKQHWTQTREETSCPLTVLGSKQKPGGDLGGLVCLIDDLGATQKVLNLSMAAGLAPFEKDVLVTTFDSIHRVDTQLQTLQSDFISSPLFNALHSVSRTRRGYLVASTGIDLLVEFSPTGEVLWTWWATDHGFSHTPTGELRELDKEADHRIIKYGTLQQTTHVNSVAELPDGRVLATLFHQGTVIAIDRESGKWETILEGLDHPHSVRILDEEHFTVADTVHGKALLVRLNSSGHGTTIEEEVDAGTSWLQDCSYNAQHNVWVLVDGKHTRILLKRGRRNGEVAQQNIAQFDLNPEWRLYEAYAF
ncbi:hypothetical protein [Ktedonobacter racemifer]|uniref:Uncharacterized protein n=1 Tax=Ktedonobacter racemifer DSM 44963 TaxID=485913 RepID=D6TZT8_KTERA|nr:hypothetical protein [Ktedonobacter racemifer]EFH82078.1 hypothetical protein Krac_2854 [Ktedonobacter racemifer DSM 44963]